MSESDDRKKRPRNNDDNSNDGSNNSGSLPPFDSSGSSSGTSSFKVEKSPKDKYGEESNFYYTLMFLDFILNILNAMAEHDDHDRD